MGLRFFLQTRTRGRFPTISLPEGLDFMFIDLLTSKGTLTPTTNRVLWSLFFYRFLFLRDEPSPKQKTNKLIK